MQKSLKNTLTSEGGFTFVEIIGAFVIFGLLFVFITRLGYSVFELNRASTAQNQMVHVAELVLENYKAGVNDMPTYLSVTGMTLDGTVNRDGDVYRRTLSHDALDGQYTVALTEERTSPNLATIRITIDTDDDRVGTVFFEGQVIVDTE